MLMLGHPASASAPTRAISMMPQRNVLSILLPLTSRAASTDAHTHADKLQHCINAVASLAKQAAPRTRSNAGPGAAQVSTALVIGIDEDDPVLSTQQALQSLHEAVTAVACISIKMQLFRSGEKQQAVDRASRFWLGHSHGQTLPLVPLCWMWWQLADVAVNELGATCFVLLGDDTSVTPSGWAGTVLERFKYCFPDGLGCLVLQDAADPGYPSFPVIGAAHLHVLGKVLPDLFLNQGGDPFLSELYRRVGRWQYYPDVMVSNKRGGIELPDNLHYNHPLYQRVYAPQAQVLHVLATWTEKLLACFQVERVTTVDVLVPCGRADVDGLRTILQRAALPANSKLPADVRTAVVVDKVPLDASTRQAFEQLRDEHPTLRLRFNGHNTGASATRNRLLQESLSELIIFFDDDVAPTPDCVEAYVRAFRDHPQERGFVGPTRLPLPPQHSHPDWPFVKRLLALGVHMSNVSFFWQAAEHIKAQHLAWGVTANMALRNTGLQLFDERFPKTGGGEDVDMCLRATGLLDGKVDDTPRGLRSVPQAVCYHPWWGGGRSLLWRRFAMWAYGDGELIDMYPQFTYRAPPSGPELFWLICSAQLLVLLILILVHSPAAAFKSPAAAQVRTWAWQLSTMLACDAVMVCIVEAVLDGLLEFWERKRLRSHRCSRGMRALASVYSTSIRFAMEAGRLAGHCARHGLWGMLARVGCRFDWFCGLMPIVPVWEWRWAIARCVCHVSAAVGILYCWHCCM